MKLSIIVPVYNMESDNKLVCCLDSILAQTFKDFEIIAVDDKSTDNSLNILYDFKNRYPDKINVIALPKNCRQGGAKNEGLRAAKGEWIGFIDSDDWIAPDMYEALINKAIITGADFVGCDYCLTDSPKNPTYTTYVQNNDDDQTGVLDIKKHKSHLLSPGSMVIKIYKHSVIKENNLSFISGIFYEDNYSGPLWSLCFTHFERVGQALYFYRQLADSTTHSVTLEKCRDRMAAMEALYKKVKENGCYEDYRAEMDYSLIGLHFRNTLFSFVSNMRLSGSFKGYSLSFIREITDRFKAFGIDIGNNPYISPIPKEELFCMKCALKSPFVFWAGYACLSYWRKYREVLMYLIFGVLTTLVNFLVYNACKIFIFNSEDYSSASNAIAWVLSVLFAYLTNRSFVFKSKANSVKSIALECVKFVGARVASGLMDMGLMEVLARALGLNDNLSKLICQVMVTVTNYIFSKLIVFKKNRV